MNFSKLIYVSLLEVINKSMVKLKINIQDLRKLSLVLGEGEVYL